MAAMGGNRVTVQHVDHVACLQSALGSCLSPCTIWHPRGMQSAKVICRMAVGKCNRDLLMVNRPIACADDTSTWPGDSSYVDYGSTQ